MSLLFFTGFHGIDTSHLDLRCVDVLNVTVGAHGRSGARGVNVTDGGYFGPPMMSAKTSVLFGAWMSPNAVKVGDDPDAGTLFECFDDAAGANDLVIKYDFTDECLFVLDANSSEIFRSANGSYPSATFMFVECAVFTHGSTGTVTLRVNGVQIYAGTGLDTLAASGTGITNIYLAGFGTDDIDIENLYISDTAGSAPHNTFLGPTTVTARFPTADATPTDWAPQVGLNNAVMVDDGNSPDDDGTTNQSATVGQVDLFTMTTFASASRYVYGYCNRMIVKASGADGREAALVHVDPTNGTTVGPGNVLVGVYEEDAQIIEESLTRFATAAEVDTLVNALKVGYELVN